MLIQPVDHFLLVWFALALARTVMPPPIST